MHFWIATLIGVFALVSAHAQPEAASAIYIKVGEAAVKKSLLALPPFEDFGKAAVGNKSVGADIFNVIFNDLNVSDYFSFIRPEAFLEDPAKVGLQPAPGQPNGFHFANWKQIGTDFLIRGGYQLRGDTIELEAYLYYVPQAKLVFGKKYQAPTAAARKLAHTFANDVIEKLTGKKGYFLTKFVAASDKPGNSRKEIYISDWDGSNSRAVSDHKSITVSPSWSPDGKSIVYTAFAYHPRSKMRNTDLFRYDIDTGKRWMISFHKGINSGATFIPGTNNLLVTLSKDGNPDIFEITRDGDVVRTVTKGPGSAMNVEPAVSPDGTKIAFSSDRGGKPMIYVMNRDGTGVVARTTVGKYNSSPAWSPDGKKMAFAGQDQGAFDIFVMDADGKNMVRLTQATKKNGRPADNEDPSFSPDGSRVMYVSNRTGSNQIYISNLDGSNERQITYDKFNYFKPKWSPYLE